jgi:hypothetical protein
MGNNLLQASSNVAVVGKPAIVPFKIFIAVFPAFCIVLSWGFFPTSAKVFTCSNASALSSGLTQLAQGEEAFLRHLALEE